MLAAIPVEMYCNISCSFSINLSISALKFKFNNYIVFFKKAYSGWVPHNLERRILSGDRRVYPMAIYPTVTPRNQNLSLSHYSAATRWWRFTHAVSGDGCTKTFAEENIVRIWKELDTLGSPSGSAREGYLWSETECGTSTWCLCSRKRHAKCRSLPMYHESSAMVELRSCRQWWQLPGGLVYRKTTWTGTSCSL